MTLRKFIQSKLDELDDIDVGTEVPDDMLVLNQVYFSYLLSNNWQNADFERNGTYSVSIIGYLKVKVSKDVDSLDVIDIVEKPLSGFSFHPNLSIISVNS
jgi:hypothetical protein